MLYFPLPHSTMTNEATPSAHTPGPWHTDSIGTDRAWILDSEGNYLAEIVAKDEYGFAAPTDQQQANACLIAVAPELLEHLCSMVAMAHSVSENWENGDLASAVRNLDRNATAAETAIAKAYGTPS
jgi:hypothetical protein